MTISVGDTIPSAEVLRMGADGPESLDIAAHIAGKKVVIFGLPGAYTSTCTSAHMPSFIRTFEAFQDKGIDEIICVSVNDVFVMDHWGESTGANAKGITMLADWDAAFTKSTGLAFSAPPVGFVNRCQRMAMVVTDGKVDALTMEEERGACVLTAGENLLELV